MTHGGGTAPTFRTPPFSKRSLKEDKWPAKSSLWYTGGQENSNIPSRDHGQQLAGLTHLLTEKGFFFQAFEIVKDLLSFSEPRRSSSSALTHW